MPFRFAALLLIAFSLLSTPAWSAPAAPIEIEITQPDGTTFIAISRGDEFANWMETKSGHSIVKKNGTWFYAEKDNEGNLRASNRAVGSLSPEELQAWPKHIAPDTDPRDYDRGKVRKVFPPAQTSEPGLDQTLGVQTQNVLTILVDYSDISFTYDASFQTLMYGASDSVAEFFEENSYGNFTIVPAAESYDTADDGIVHVMRSINHPNFGLGGWASEASDIVAEADSSVNFAAFDTSGDGTVSADELSIVIILAGYEASYGAAKTPNVWGHQGGFTALPLDGVDLSPYTMFGERHGTQGNTDDHPATIGIMCHELGHLMFNLPDLYDTNSANGDSAGIGDWGLMAGGSWNFDFEGGDMWSGESPAHLAAWSKIRVGFTVPDDVETPQSGVSFPNAGANPSARKIWIDKYRTANGEYILLENRQETGYDAGLPGNGLMIWHVDQGVRGNADETRKLVDLEEADGLAELDANINGGDGGDPYPGSTSNTTYDDGSDPDSKANTGATTGIAVSNISASMATMFADLQPASEPVGDHVRYDEDGPDASIPIAQTVRIGSQMLNDTTAMDTLDGIDVFVNDPTGATVDVYLYESMLNGVPETLIDSEEGLAVGPLWQRILLATPQPFPAGAERGIVVRIANDSSNRALSWDSNGDISGRSFFDAEDDGTFTAMTNCSSICGDVSLVALLSASPPAATTITPETPGPTNADNIDFEVTFDKDVVNFDNADDVVIDHTGTAHTGVTITATNAASYTATVTGISGDGSFTLAVDTTSGVQDTVGTPLESSVTSSSVEIDNTPPDIAIGPPSEDPTAGGPVDYTVSYTGAAAVTLVEADITLNQTGDADGSVAVSGSGTSSRTVTISGITGNGTLGISIAAGTASDTAGNSAPDAGPSETFVVENPDPAPEFDSTPVPGTTLAFGEVEIDATSGELFVTVDNIGTAELTLSCAITGANADQFNVVACPTPVAAEGSMQLSVTCSPNSSGEKTASLDVTTNDADEPDPSYPLTCTGVEISPDLIKEHGFEDSDATGA